jgi:hypothetical protein
MSGSKGWLRSLVARDTTGEDPALNGLTVLSPEPVANDFLDRLSRDLDDADVCRFAVAFITDEALSRLGRDRLTRALRHPASCGVSSLSCTTGFKPLLRLQRQIGIKLPRLKYFMEPMAVSSSDAESMLLMHSKIVYLAQERKGRSITYVGSHNWSGRALGPGGPRNAEMSFRFEEPFESGHLAGQSSAISGLANKHIMACYNLPVCLPATDDNRPCFEQWVEKVCRKARQTPLEGVSVVLAVKEDKDEIDWPSLADQSAYLQIFDERDGQQIPSINTTLLVLVWNSEDSLRRRQLPTILICRPSTTNALRDSAVGGSNQAVNPIAGFRVVIWDHKQRNAVREGRASKRRDPVVLPSGMRVDVFDMITSVAESEADSAVFDDGATPRYRFHLEIDSVVCPVDAGVSPGTRMLWSAESLAVSDKRIVKMISSPGFEVDPHTDHSMRSCFENLFGVDLRKARVLPYSDWEEPRAGRRVAKHLLHGTFIDDSKKQSARAFYMPSRVGDLVAEVDYSEDRKSRLERVQQVYTTPVEQLRERWTRIARKIMEDLGA